MGFNTFAVFYEFLTGQSDFGPHSFWVATLVETGIDRADRVPRYFAWLVACALRMTAPLDRHERGCWATGWSPRWPAPRPPTCST